MINNKKLKILLIILSGLILFYYMYISLFPYKFSHLCQNNNGIVYVSTSNKENSIVIIDKESNTMDVHILKNNLLRKYTKYSIDNSLLSFETVVDQDSLTYIIENAKRYEPTEEIYTLFKIKISSYTNTKTVPSAINYLFKVDIDEKKELSNKYDSSKIEVFDSGKLTLINNTSIWILRLMQVHRYNINYFTESILEHNLNYKEILLDKGQYAVYDVMISHTAEIDDYKNVIFKGYENKSEFNTDKPYLDFTIIDVID